MGFISALTPFHLARVGAVPVAIAQGPTPDGLLLGTWWSPAKFPWDIIAYWTYWAVPVEEKHVARLSNEDRIPPEGITAAGNVAFGQCPVLVFKPRPFKRLDIKALTDRFLAY